MRCFAKRIIASAANTRITRKPTVLYFFFSGSSSLDSLPSKYANNSASISLSMSDFSSSFFASASSSYFDEVRSLFLLLLDVRLSSFLFSVELCFKSSVETSFTSKVWSDCDACSVWLSTACFSIVFLFTLNTSVCLESSCCPLLIFNYTMNTPVRVVIHLPYSRAVLPYSKRQDGIHLLNSRPASLELFFILLLTSLLNEMFYRNTLSYAALTFILQLLGIVVSWKIRLPAYFVSYLFSLTVPEIVPLFSFFAMFAHLLTRFALSS